MKRFTLLLAISLVLTGCGVNPDDVAIDNQIAADKLRVSKCDEMRKKATEISEYSSKLVIEARTLQRIWITEEMNKLKESEKISLEEYDLFSLHVQSEITPPIWPGGELDLLMKKVVTKGYIKPYLPRNVVDLGTKAALSPNSAKYQVDYPECFSEIEFDGIKLLAELTPNKGVWGNKVENPADLIP